jgi:putative endonuclease
MTSLGRHVDRAGRARRAGEAAEELARAALEARGWSTLSRNVVVRGGELDLVMRDGDTIVVVEVRHRTRADFGGAAASVGARKRALLRRAAQVYLARHGLGEAPVRFDVVLLDGPLPAARLTHLRDAF